MRSNWIQQWNDDDLNEWLIASYSVFTQQPELFVKKYSAMMDVKYKNYDLGIWMLAYHKAAQQGVQADGLEWCIKCREFTISYSSGNCAVCNTARR